MNLDWWSWWSFIGKVTIEGLDVSVLESVVQIFLMKLQTLRFSAALCACGY